MQNTNFNKQHPELKEGEEFYMNCYKGDEERIVMLMSEAHPIYSFRAGCVAYTPTGKVITTHAPTFRKILA